MRNWHTSIFRLMLCLCLTVVLWSAFPASYQKAAAQGENLLANPGFEGTYVQINGDPSLTVAPNWQPWFLGPPAGAPSSVNLRPDYQPAPSNRVKSGSAAQEYNTFFATHDAGVFQRVPVTSGSELKFSVFVYVWSSATFEDPNESISPQEVTVQVGIDPTGGTDPESASIIWSTAEEFYDEYRELSITTTAQGNAVTVYVRTNPQAAVGVNNIYVDDASLVVVGQPQPSTPASPTPEGGDDDDDDSGDDDDDDGSTTATATIQATTATGSTATATRTPTQTPVPDAVQQFPNRLTYTVVANDTVSGIATRFNSTVAAIIAANGLDTNGFITIGQQLTIPVPAGQGQPAITATPTTAPTVATAAPSATTPAGSQPGTGTAPQPSPQNTPGIHVVQPGENLFRIALRYNTTVEALATLNNITNPNLIFVGTSLRVPVLGTPTTPPTTPGTGGTSTHLVQTGENAFRIALRYGVTVEELARVNNIANPNLIFAGQTLIIPR